MIKMAKKAFTLVELLVVISIIAILMAVLMPALGKARQQSKAVVCISNLRQMVIAANAYILANEGYYPLAGFTENRAGGIYNSYGWDYLQVRQWGVLRECEPGLLWQKNGTLKIQQCPTFKGGANSQGDPYTGYNYNASYVGGVMSREVSGRTSGVNSSKADQIRRAFGCALFGDGEYGTSWSANNGANKYMRSPFIGKLENMADHGGLRYAGTQGYRHLGSTNVGWADGHASKVKERYTETYSSQKTLIVSGTGFLSPDNSAYDLE
ncbi:MAG: hypothetical protein A2Y13_10900 [Planctomycetes bacterium GWC2_45_44]|nr:MAG: hypothetical protein A2Y13_10900 [Planctomycetes bacterium GWC2_45_44]